MKSSGCREKASLACLYAILALSALLAGCQASQFDSEGKAGPISASSETLEKTRIAAILPLSGPSATWGENVMNGMELALLTTDNVEVIYQDSKGTSSDGLSAYNYAKLQGFDMVVAALSIVSVPVSDVTEREKVTLLATLTSADGIAKDYSSRYFTGAENLAQPLFEEPTSPVIGAKRLAVVYRKDEFGESVAKRVKSLAREHSKDIEIVEPFTPNEADFSTILTKVKASGADTLIFIPVTPSEAITLLKQADALGVKIPLVEASTIFSDPLTKANAPNITFYTNIFSFSEEGNALEFKAAYRVKYGKEPNFGAAFGYDIIKLVSGCPKSEINKCIKDKEEVNGTTGLVKGVSNGDIKVPLKFIRLN